MHLANKKAEKKVKRQRWLKYGTYVAITGIVLVSIFLDRFRVLAVIIIVVGLYEMVKTTTSRWVSDSCFSFSSRYLCLMPFAK